MALSSCAAWVFSNVGRVKNVMDGRLRFVGMAVQAACGAGVSGDDLVHRGSCWGVRVDVASGVVTSRARTCAISRHIV